MHRESPAYPQDRCPGVSYIDYMAAQALPGLIVKFGQDDSWPADRIVRMAYEIAEEMHVIHLEHLSRQKNTL